MNGPRLFKTGLMLAACVALTSCSVFHPPKANLPSRTSIVPGEQITVQKNQNVYAIARQYNVSMRDLMVLNNLQAPYIVRSGQRLTLPAAVGSSGSMDMSSSNIASAPMPAPSAASISAVQQSSLAPIEVAQLTPPPSAKSVSAPKPLPPTQAERAEALTTPAPIKSVVTTATAPQQMASITPSLSQPPAEAPSISFVWPVQGPVLSAFGPKGQGLNNDGVNIGAPKGAPVVAAASGIVVYSGNEMKGFGNLILIRHQGGWVTAYAHLDRALVNKDAVVAQGDMIGTVGKSGGVAAPQLHFETRYQGKTVDPNSAIKG